MGRGHRTAAPLCIETCRVTQQKPAQRFVALIECDREQLGSYNFVCGPQTPKIGLGYWPCIVVLTMSPQILCMVHKPSSHPENTQISTQDASSEHKKAQAQKAMQTSPCSQTAPGYLDNHKRMTISGHEKCWTTPDRLQTDGSFCNTWC